MSSGIVGLFHAITVFTLYFITLISLFFNPIKQIIKNPLYQRFLLTLVMSLSLPLQEIIDVNIFSKHIFGFSYFSKFFPGLLFLHLAVALSFNLLVHPKIGLEAKRIVMWSFFSLLLFHWGFLVWVDISATDRCSPYYFGFYVTNRKFFTSPVQFIYSLVLVYYIISAYRDSKLLSSKTEFTRCVNIRNDKNTKTNPIRQVLKNRLYRCFLFSILVSFALPFHGILIVIFGNILIVGYRIFLDKINAIPFFDFRDEWDAEFMPYLLVLHVTVAILFALLIHPKIVLKIKRVVMWFFLFILGGYWFIFFLAKTFHFSCKFPEYQFGFYIINNYPQDPNSTFPLVQLIYTFVLGYYVIAAWLESKKLEEINKNTGKRKLSGDCIAICDRK